MMTTRPSDSGRRGTPVSTGCAGRAGRQAGDRDRSGGGCSGALLASSCWPVHRAGASHPGRSFAGPSGAPGRGLSSRSIAGRPPSAVGRHGGPSRRTGVVLPRIDSAIGRLRVSLTDTVSRPAEPPSTRSPERVALGLCFRQAGLATGSRRPQPTTRLPTWRAQGGLGRRHSEAGEQFPHVPLGDVPGAERRRRAVPVRPAGGEQPGVARRGLERE